MNRVYNCKNVTKINTVLMNGVTLNINKRKPFEW